MGNNQTRRNRVFTALGCVGVFMLFGAGAEAYNRYRYYRSVSSRSLADYSAVMPSRSRPLAPEEMNSRNGRVNWNLPPQAMPTAKDSYQVPHLYARTRGHHGTLQEGNVYAFRKEFAVYQQNYKSMYSALGYPNQVNRHEDVWLIQKKDIYGQHDGYGRLRVRYNDQGGVQEFTPEW